MKHNDQQPVSPKLSIRDFMRKFDTNDVCRAYLESKRWPNGPVCPHCENGTKHVTKHNGKSTRDGLYTCGSCRRQFTVTVGTIFEGSHLALPKWFSAIYLMCSHKKGISANQLKDEIDVTYKTAWFVCHRIRLAMKTQAFAGFLKGTIEADETYLGGKKKPGKRGRGASGKTVVFAMVERGGGINARTIPDVTRDTLQPIIAQTVLTGSNVMTDQFRSYRGLAEGYNHKVVDHGKCFVDGEVHTNNAESFFALLKRGVHGTFHHISKEKTDMYCGEFGFRFNSTGLTAVEKFEQVVSHCGGRLKWNFKDNGSCLDG